MPKTVQIRDISDETYQRLSQKAAEVHLSVPEYLRRLADRDAQRLSMTEWLDRTSRRGGPVPGIDTLATLDELRGPWPGDDRS